MSKHTATPWHTSKHGTPAYAPQFGVYAEGARNDHVIVTGENAEADAALIVKAVNSHADLVAALRQLMVVAGEADALHDAGLVVPRKVWDRLLHANIDARAAIKNAGAL